MSRIDLVVFDMAGTTVQDRGEVIASFLDALHSHEIEAAEKDIRQYRGLSKREAIRSLVNEKSPLKTSDDMEIVEKVYETFCERLERRFTREGVAPMPRAAEVFDWLHQKGVKVATTTGFGRNIADIILKQLSWDEELVDVTVTADEVSQGRPAPYMIFRAMERTHVVDVKRVVKVGDTSADILAGKNADLDVVVGVLSGAHDTERLRKAGAGYIISDVGVLPDMLGQEGFV